MTKKWFKTVRYIVFVIITVFTAMKFVGMAIPVINASDQEQPQQMIDQDETDKTMDFYIIYKDDVKSHINQHPLFNVVPQCRCKVIRIDMEMRVINSIIDQNVLEATPFQFEK